MNNSIAIVSYQTIVTLSIHTTLINFHLIKSKEIIILLREKVNWTTEGIYPVASKLPASSVTSSKHKASYRPEYKTPAIIQSDNTITLEKLLETLFQPMIFIWCTLKKGKLACKFFVTNRIQIEYF